MLLKAGQLARIRQSLSARYDALEGGERPVDAIESAVWRWHRRLRTRFVESYLQAVVEAFALVIKQGFGGTIPDDAEVTSARMQFRPRGLLRYLLDGEEREIHPAGRNDIIGTVKSASARKSVSTYHERRPYEWSYEVTID